MAVYRDPFDQQDQDPLQQFPRQALLDQMQSPIGLPTEPQAPTGPAPGDQLPTAPSTFDSPIMGLNPDVPDLPVPSPGGYEPPVPPPLPPGPAPAPPPAPPTAPPSQPQTPPPAFNYEAARDAWQSGRYPLTEEGAAAWARDFGIQYGGGDSVQLPNGAWIDLIGNFRGAPGGWTRTWTGEGDGEGSGGGWGGTGSGTGTETGTVGGAESDVERLLRDRLLALMGQSDVVDPNDPAFQAQFLPVRHAIERNAQRMREAAAERAAAEGTSFGGRGLGGEIGSIGELTGAQTASALGGFLGQEIQAKRQQLMQALQLANAIGARDQAVALQERLSALDNAFRYAQLQQQGSQWNDQYGLSRLALLYQMNRDPLSLLLGG